MGYIKKYILEKLIIGILVSDETQIQGLNKLLISKFGRIDYESPLMDFTYTDYYNEEMGIPIKRYFVSFQKLVDPSELSEIKIYTNKIEKKFSVEGRRKVNLDPGIMSLSKFILATTKDNAHRIPLKKGMFGEITLSYVNKKFRSLDWTYFDYKTEKYAEIFKEIRNIYSKQLKDMK